MRLRWIRGISTVLLSLVGIVSMTGEARADVSSWLEVGGGVGWLGQPHFDDGMTPTMRLGTGMGSNPLKPVVLGGVFRADTFFGEGTDLSLLLRVVDRGYALGDFGIGVDVGGVSRFWGKNRHGGTANLLLGAPYGVFLSVGGSLLSEQTRSITATLGIDLARLTIYRRSGGNWWKNPLPLDRPVHPLGEK